jgi:hypothetical protein
MPTMTDEDAVARFLRKVQGLVDKANGNTTDEEARALLAKADELMVKYSLDPSMVLDPNRPNSARPVFDEKPERRTIIIMEDATGEVDWQLKAALTTLFAYCARHLFVRIGKRSYTEAVVFGYPIDINFLEMFFLRLKIHMFSNMLTTIDPEKPWVEILVGLKNMGYRWEDIHYKFRDANHPGYPFNGQYWERRFGVRFTAEAKRYTELHGLPRNKSSNPVAWRADFVDGYVGTIYRRLGEMRQATMHDNPNLPALVADKKSKVEEAFYDEFPELRPHPADCQCDYCSAVRRQRNKPVRMSSAGTRNWNLDALAAGGQVAKTADLTDKGSIA